MATTPIIRSSGSINGVVTGFGRRDLNLTEVVTLTDAQAANSGASYQWAMDAKPVGSSASIINPTLATASFTCDVAGSYRILCTVNGTLVKDETLAVELPTSGLRIPAFKEGEVTNRYTGEGNVQGWHVAYDELYRYVESLTAASGAPADAQYIVAAVHASLSAERVATATATISLDFGTAGQAKWNVIDASITPAKMESLTGLSVLGRSASGAPGVMAAITGTADQVLRVNGAGNALGFGTIATAGITDAAVTAAKMFSLTGASVLGRAATGAPGVMAAITGTTIGDVLTVQGDNSLAFSTPASSGAPTNATYIVQTANGSLSNEQAMGALATGIVKNTTTTGVQSIAVANTDYPHPSATYITQTATNAPSGAQALSTLATGMLKVATTTGVLTSFVPTANTIPLGSGGVLVDSTLTLAANVLTHAASSSGATVSALVKNSSGTASSGAQVQVETVASGGDPTYRWKRDSVEGIFGFRSSNTSWQLNDASSFGTTPLLSLKRNSGGAGSGTALGLNIEAPTSDFQDVFEFRGLNAAGGYRPATLRVTNLVSGGARLEAWSSGNDCGTAYLQNNAGGWHTGIDDSVTGDPYVVSFNDGAGSSPVPGTNDAFMVTRDRNFAFGAGGTTNFNSMVGGYFEKSVTTPPSTSPTGGWYRYADATGYWLIGPSGTTTQLAVA
jgi:hypothetical protein